MALWIKDWDSAVPPAGQIHQPRFDTALALVRAGYEDLIALRDELSPGTHSWAIKTMPRKLRAPKYRYDDKAEFEAFRLVFTCGHDFFFQTGLIESVHVWPPEDRPAAEKIWRAGIRDAWQRLGRRFLETWEPKGPPPHRQRPWALEQFGEP